MSEGLLSDGGAGGQLVFSCPSMVCERHLSVPSALCYKGFFCFPAVLNFVLVCIYFSGFISVLFERGEGAVQQSRSNVC